MKALRVEHRTSELGPFKHSKGVPTELYWRIIQEGNNKIRSPYEDFGTKWGSYFEENKGNFRCAFSNEDLFWEFANDFLSELIFYGFRVIEYTLDDSKILIGSHNIIFTEESVINKEIILE